MNNLSDKRIGKSSMASAFAQMVMSQKLGLPKELKGGNAQMEIKSRYEVIAQLEEKKRELIVDRDSLDVTLKSKQRELKELKRDLEDKEEEISDFESSMKEQKITTEELIKSVDASLDRLTKVRKSKK